MYSRHKPPSQMMAEINQEYDNHNLTLRKMKLFEYLMKKRTIDIEFISSNYNADKKNYNRINLKRRNDSTTLNNSIQNTSIKEYCSVSDVLIELNELETQCEENKLDNKLNSIRLLLSKGKCSEVLYNQQVIEYVLNLLLKSNLNTIFSSSLKLIVFYSSYSLYLTNKLNSVETINKLITRIQINRDYNNITSLFTIIGNIIIDCSNKVLCQSNLFVYLNSIIVNSNNDTLLYNADDLNECIFWFLYLNIKDDYTPFLYQIPSLIPFIVSDLQSLSMIDRNSQSEKNINLPISICYYLSKNNEQCKQLVSQNCLNYLLQLFNYLIMKSEDIANKKVIVLSSESVYGILLIFKNMLSTAFIHSNSQLEADKLITCLIELIKRYKILSTSSNCVESNKLYSEIQKELMSLIENISHVNRKVFERLLEDKLILKLIIKCYLKNNQCLSSIIRIINEIVSIDNTVINTLIEVQLFSNSFNHVVNDFYIAPDTKKDYIELLNNVFISSIQNKSQSQLLNQLINEMNKGRVIDSITQLSSQNNNDTIGNMCNTVLMSYKELTLPKII